MLFVKGIFYKIIEITSKLVYTLYLRLSWWYNILKSMASVKYNQFILYALDNVTGGMVSLKTIIMLAFLLN
jgi:hypothetical protein